MIMFENLVFSYENKFQVTMDKLKSWKNVHTLKKGE